MLPAAFAATITNEYIAVKETKNNDDAVHRNSNCLWSYKYQMTSKHCLILQTRITNVWERQEQQIQLFPFPSSRIMHLGSCRARRSIQERAHSSPALP